MAMEAISAIYERFIETVVRFGVEPSMAPIVPACVLLLFLGLIIKSFQSGGSATSGSKKKKTASGKDKNGSPPPAHARKGAKKTDNLIAADYRVVSRHFERYEVELKSEFVVENLGDNTSHRCRILDLSESGLAFAADEDLQFGWKVRIELPNLDKGYGEKTFDVSGEVMHGEDYDGRKFKRAYGIRFFHLMREKRELLKILLEKYGP